MDYKSHTKEEVRKAKKEGKKIFALDTANKGEDDTLIGNSREEVLVDILHYHDLENLPDDWSLDEITGMIGHAEDCACPACKGSQGLVRVSWWLDRAVVEKLRTEAKGHGGQRRIIEEALKKYFQDRP